MEKKEILLECRGICKSFGKHKVLNDIQISIAKGEVHAFLGQNGAGKSTLVKIITGVYSKDKGEIRISGQAVKINSPKDAEEQGIAIIHQDQQMVPYFDVVRNAYLGFEEMKGGFLDFKRMQEKVAEKLAFIRADFTADRLSSTLSVGEREQVAIVSALLRNPKILILDEPTASLSNKEIERLFEVIELLKNSGVTIIYISHHLDEIFKITDSLTILRDSFVQGTFKTKEITHKEIVTMMIGKELKEFFPKEQAQIGDCVLEIEDLHSGMLVKGASFCVHKGEILGLAGLVGAGRTETVLAMYGAENVDSGSIKIDGKPYKPKSPLDAKKAGIAFIPEDRRNEGIVSGMSIGENLSLATTKLWAASGLISKVKEKSFSEKIIEALHIISTGKDQSVSELSGGNQQKVVIGRWLTGDFQIFVFDQPTTGVDIGAKTEIYKQMVKLAKKGCGIIFISSENEELLGMCDRIAVMAKGKVVKTFLKEEATEHDLLYWSASEGEEKKEVG